MNSLKTRYDAQSGTVKSRFDYNGQGPFNRQRSGEKQTQKLNFFTPCTGFLDKQLNSFSVQKNVWESFGPEVSAPAQSLRMDPVKPDLRKPFFKKHNVVKRKRFRSLGRNPADIFFHRLLHRAKHHEEETNNVSIKHKATLLQHKPERLDQLLMYLVHFGN